MKDPIVTLRKHDDLLTRLLQELAAPALPAHGLPAARLPPPPGSEGVDREVPPRRLARMLWGPLLVIARQAGDPDPLGFQLRAPCRFALARAHDVHAATAREVSPRRRLGAGVGRYRHV